MSTKFPPEIPQDEWVWGRERLLWGFDPSHQFTFKMLEPKRGKEGCLSLQYHHEKSECWFVLRGVAWALVIIDDKVCTRLMRPGDFQQLPCGVIHRLMGVSEDVQVLEPSTPDRHAADKTVEKDVVRLHCVQGRDCEEPSGEIQSSLVSEAIQVTEEAIMKLESGEEPTELNADYLKGRGAHHIQ